MPIKLPTPFQGEIDELRRLFNEKYTANRPKDRFHPVDLERVRNDSLWCQRFLEMYELDMPTALEKLWETCVWRKAYGANDINERNLNIKYLHEGAVFVHNHDVDGMPLLIFNTRMHNKSKNMDEMMRVIVYWIERTQREKYLTKLTIFFDMSETGVSQLDIDFVKAIINLFQLYYPNALNYILVYEISWILNAAFKVIKGLLPPKAHEILKMITKKDIKTYVDKTNCLEHWGGDDDYQFCFLPELTPKKKQAANGVVKSPPDSTTTTTTSEAESVDKKVHFANSIKARDSDKMEYEYQELHTPHDPLPTKDEMLRIDPADTIFFTRGDAKEGTLTITSIAKIPVSYKIQTTSPEKFRVRPRCGVLGPNESISIGILLKPEHSLSQTAKDKFLVMGMPTATADCSQAEVAELWKNKAINSPDVEQHRLVCQYRGEGGPAMKGASPGSSNKSVTVNKGGEIDLQEQTLKLGKELKFTQTLQYVTLLLLGLLALGFATLLYNQSEPSCKAKQGFCSK